MATDVRQTQDGYDQVAPEYAEKYADEMDHKPFDCDQLDRLAREVGALGPICDLGCGPGQIARYLHSKGVAACGIDLSAEMVNHARRLNPEIPFQQGDMLALTGVADDTFGGIAAFYSIIHIAPEDVVTALRELRRVLRPAGTLLLTFHIGAEVRHLDEWWGKKVSLDFIFYTSDQMRQWLAAAGYEGIDVIERDPNPEVEVATRRAYIFARKPA